MDNGGSSNDENKNNIGENINVDQIDQDREESGNKQVQIDLLEDKVESGNAQVQIDLPEDKVESGNAQVQAQEKRFINRFLLRRSSVSKLIDMALLMANVSQLNVLLKTGFSQKFHYVLLTLVVASITLQITFAIVELVISKLNGCVVCQQNDQTEYQQNRQTKYQQNVEPTKQEDNRTNMETIATTQTLKTTRKCSCKKIRSNLLITSNIMVLLIIISNVFITGFGLEPDPKN